MRKRVAFFLAVSAIALLGGASLVLSQEAKIDPDVYKQIRYRYIGSVGNRAISVVSIPGNANIYYVGAASGGIFRTTDGGVHWEPVFDSQAVASVGSLAIAPGDPSVVWAGTGEPYIRSHISVGQGIFKSMDAGKTWTMMGLEKTGRIGNVIVDPRNSDIVFACSLGHAYGPQQERGVYRTADGGKNWERVLFVDENTGCSDLTMDPNNPHTLFAGMWQIEIHTWGRTSGGAGSGLFKSTDGGMRWKRLEGHGLPHAPIGRVAVRVAPSNSNRVYAEIETGDGVPLGDNPGQSGQLWRSEDGGDTWALVSSDRDIRGRTHYYTREEISPSDENEVYFFSAAFSHTLDGGKTLTPLPSEPGGDNHEMWIDPTNADRMAVVNDGGVSISINHGRSWNHIQLPIAQIYHVTVDNQIPYYVYGNRQDGSSYSGPSNSLQFGGPITRSVWHPVSGGESGFATVDPVENNIVWNSGTGSGSVGGTVMLYDNKTGQARPVEVWPETTIGSPAGEVKYRFNWEFPIAISPQDHKRVYVGSQFVHVTNDGGNSWQVISPDLTRNDKSKMGISGGLTPDNIGVEYAGVVFSIAESPKQAGVIWAGTNDGEVQITRDGGKNWSNVTANIGGLPEWGTVSNIEASRWDAGTAYITVDLHQVNNRDPFVYKTADFGKTWKKITNGIPANMLSYAHCVREIPFARACFIWEQRTRLYVSFNDGGTWQPLQNNLAHAPVYWIAPQEKFHDLAIATYGRGFWILDDITPLQQMTPEILGADAHLFAPRDAYRFRGAEQAAAVSYDPTAGVNPPYGADINYYLKAAPKEKEDVKLVISDAAGKTVRTVNGTKEAGINRVWWDLQFEPTKQIKLKTSPMYAPDVTVGAEGWRELPGNPRISMLAPPGTYAVKLMVAGKEQGSEQIRVLKDPHSTGTVADIEAQNKLENALIDEMNSAADTVNTVENVRGQIASLETQLGDDDKSKAIRTAADDLAKKLIAYEGNLVQLKATGHGQDEVRWTAMLVDKIIYLAGQVGDSDFPPTTQQNEVHELLKQQLAKAQEDWKQIETKDLAAFNAMLREKNVPNIIAKMP